MMLRVSVRVLPYGVDTFIKRPAKGGNTFYVDLLHDVETFIKGPAT